MDGLRAGVLPDKKNVDEPILVEEVSKKPEKVKEVADGHRKKRMRFFGRRRKSPFSGVLAGIISMGVVLLLVYSVVIPVVESAINRTNVTSPGNFMGPVLDIVPTMFVMCLLVFCVTITFGLMGG